MLARGVSKAGISTRPSKGSGLRRSQGGKGTYVRPSTGGGLRPTGGRRRRRVVGLTVKTKDRISQYKKTYELLFEFPWVKMVLYGTGGSVIDKRDFVGVYDLRIYEVRKCCWLSKIAAAEWNKPSFWKRLQALTPAQADALVRGVIMDLVPGHPSPDNIYPRERVWAIFRNKGKEPLDLAELQKNLSAKQEIVESIDIQTYFMEGAIKILGEPDQIKKHSAEETIKVLQALLDNGDDQYIWNHGWLRDKHAELAINYKETKGIAPKPTKSMLRRFLMANLNIVTKNMRKDVTEHIKGSIKSPSNAGACTREEVESFANKMRKHVHSVRFYVYDTLIQGGWSNEQEKYEMHFEVLLDYTREHYNKHPKSVVRGMVELKSIHSPL